MDSKVIKSLKKDLESTLASYEGLKIISKNGFPREIVGNFQIKDDHQVVQGEFGIRVLIPLKYPYDVPLLFETTKLIPRTLDRHMNEIGLACVEQHQRLMIVASRGLAIKDFFDRYIYKYFCWQILYDSNEVDSLKDWPHYEDGSKQFYKEILELDDLATIQTCLKAILQNRFPSRNSQCICGGHKKYKRCHESAFNELRYISKSQLGKDISLF